MNNSSIISRVVPGCSLEEVRFQPTKFDAPNLAWHDATVLVDPNGVQIATVALEAIPDVRVAIKATKRIQGN